MGPRDRSLLGLSSVRFVLVFFVLGMFAFLTACASSSHAGATAPQTVNVTVTPNPANAFVGKSQSFEASAFGSSNTAVSWSVTESGGGTIDSSGNYTAPATAGTYHVVATSVANPADSGSAPVVVTVPQPTFTSVPPTGAAQDQPYTYTVAATDPAGTNVTYALTSGPVGAALSSGSTVTWTPTAQQSRENNAFAVTATTAAGGSATQFWAVAPTGTVQGSLFIMHWSADGTVGIEDNSAEAPIYSWAALVPQADGSLTVLPGTGYPDATFAIPDVPAGYYWLQFQPGEVVWTNASYLDYGADAIGHKQLPATTQVFGCNLTGLDPFDPINDALELYSINAQAFAVVVEDQLPSDPSPAPFPGSGSTVCDADPTVSFTTGDFGAIGGIYGISPSSGDIATTQQFEAASSGALAAPFAGALIGPALNQSLDIEGNYPFPFPTFIVPGAMSQTQPQAQDFNVTFSSWANAFNSAGPTQTQAAVPQEFEILLSAQQQAPALTRTNPLLSGTSPNLAVALATPSSAWPKDASGNNVWPQDGDIGTLNYNNPFTTGMNGAPFTNVYEGYIAAQYSIPVPNITTPLQPVLTNFFWDPNPPTGFAPDVQPVGSPQINGTSLFTASTVSTASPTLSWTAPTALPANGSAIFNILICAPTQAADCNPSGSAQTGFIYSFSQYPSTAFTVPAGILTPGTTYLFFIGSELRTDFDPLHPERFDLPWAQSWSVSAAITVSASAAPGIVHGDRSLMRAKAGQPKVSGAQPQVVSFGPTIGSQKMPAFTGWQSPFLVRPEKGPPATSYRQQTTQK